MSTVQMSQHLDPIALCLAVKVPDGQTADIAAPTIGLDQLLIGPSEFTSAFISTLTISPDNTSINALKSNYEAVFSLGEGDNCPRVYELTGSETENLLVIVRAFAVPY